MLSLSSKWRKMLWYTSPNVSPSSLSKALRRLEAILCCRSVSFRPGSQGDSPGNQNSSLDKWGAHFVPDHVPGQQRAPAQLHKGSELGKNWWIIHGNIERDRTWADFATKPMRLLSLVSHKVHGVELLHRKNFICSRLGDHWEWLQSHDSRSKGRGVPIV